MDDFKVRNANKLTAMAKDKELQRLSQEWYLAADQQEYAYHFTWFGLPIIQYPQDILAMQEIIYKVQPDLIIETGIARGGSMVFYATMLALLGGDRKVLGIDVDIRAHNKAAILNHPYSNYIEMLEGSSVDPNIISKVYNFAEKYTKIMVVLDANHTAAHVYSELQAYSSLVDIGSYIVVFDTQVEFTPPEQIHNRPWGPGNSPYTAVQQFLRDNQRFIADTIITTKLQITECPGGYLQCVAEM